MILPHYCDLSVEFFHYVRGDVDQCFQFFHSHVRTPPLGFIYKSETTSRGIRCYFDTGRVTFPQFIFELDLGKRDLPLVSIDSLWSSSQHVEINRVKVVLLHARHEYVILLRKFYVNFVQKF